MISVNAQLSDRHNRYSDSNQYSSTNSKIEDQVYLTFNFSIPVLGDYAQYYGWGIGIDFGMDKYLGLRLPEVMKIGIDYGFSLNMLPSNISSNRLLLIDTKVGVVYTYQVIDNLTIDAKLTLKPKLSNIGEVADFDFNFLAGVRSGIGFYANYKTWRIGFELSNGNMRYVGIFDEVDYGLNTGRFDISLGFKF